MHTFALVALVDARGRVLMQERGPDASLDPDRWGLPGGDLEPGETPGEAALRELEEETGVTGVPLVLLGRFRFLRSACGTDDVLWLFWAFADLSDADVVCREGRRMTFVDPRDTPALEPNEPGVLGLLAVTGTRTYRRRFGDPGLPGAGTRAFATVVLVDPAGRLLLQERDEHAPIDPERWGLCGGHLEPGEEPRQGAVRELEEETGVVLAADELILWREIAVDHRRAHGSIDPMHVFVAPTTLTDADIDCREGRRIVFVDPATARGLDLTAAAAVAVPAFLASDRYAEMAP